MSVLRDRINMTKDYFEAQKQKVEIERFVESKLKASYSEPVPGEPGLYRWIYGTTADDIIQNKIAGCFWIHFDQKTISCRMIRTKIRVDGKLTIENEDMFLRLSREILKFFDQKGFTLYHKQAKATKQDITDWFNEE